MRNRCKSAAKSSRNRIELNLSRFTVAETNLSTRCARARRNNRAAARSRHFPFRVANLIDLAELYPERDRRFVRSAPTSKPSPRLDWPLHAPTADKVIDHFPIVRTSACATAACRYGASTTPSNHASAPMPREIRHAYHMRSRAPPFSLLPRHLILARFDPRQTSMVVAHKNHGDGPPADGAADLPLSPAAAGANERAHADHGAVGAAPRSGGAGRVVRQRGCGVVPRVLAGQRP